MGLVVDIVTRFLSIHGSLNIEIDFFFKIDLVLLLPAVLVFTWSMLQVICLKVSDGLRRCLIANLYLTVSITIYICFAIMHISGAHLVVWVA